MTKEVGTPFYQAPEQKTDNYGLEVDIWSIGLVLS